jgi:signal transduction histidine kinase
LFAQNMKLDSLKLELKKTTAEDIHKVQILNQLSTLSYPDYIQNSILYAKKALLLAEKLGSKKEISDAHSNLAASYRIQSDYISSTSHSYQALKIQEEIKYEIGLVKTLNNLGLINIQQQNYKQALIYFNKSYSIAKSLNDKKNISLSLNNIADIYSKQNEYEKAMKYFKITLELNKKIQDTLQIGLSLTNIGIIYIKTKNFPKGLEFLNKSVVLYKNDSSIYNGYNMYEIGKAYYFMALQEKNQKKKSLLLKKAKDYLDKSVVIYSKQNFLADLQLSYKYLADVIEEQGNYKETLSFLEKNKTLKDSVFSRKNLNQISNINTERIVELRNKQIEIQDLQINNKSRQIYLLIAISVTVILLLLLFILLYRSKKETNKKLNIKNTTISGINNQKDKFFSIIAHDLRGPFNGFLGLTELLAEDLDSMENNEIQFVAGTMRNSATNLNRLLENLLEWSRMEQGLIPFSPKEHKLLPAVSECIAQIQETAKSKKITITAEIPEKITVFADHNILHAVIRNIVSNAVKFTPNGGFINIATTEDSKNTTISITDTGIGMNQKITKDLFRLDVQTNRKGTNEEPSTGLGLIICKEFMEKHGGTIWVESEENKGSSFYFNFPKNKNS